MIRSVRLVIVLVCAVFVTACATTQAIQIPAKTSRIGVISAIGNYATINNVSAFSTTNNYYPIGNLNLDAPVSLWTKQLLTNLGYQNVTVINLPSNNPIVNAHYDIIDIGWTQNDFKPAIKQYLNNYMRQYNLDYLIFLMPSVSCPINGNCNMDSAQGFGVTNLSMPF